MVSRDEILANLATDRVRTRPVTISGILLLIQAAGFLGYAVYRLAQVDWSRELRFLDTVSQAAADTFLLGMLLAALAGTGLLAGVGVLLVRSLGWLLAMITQGIGLLICLLLYFQRNIEYVYPIMAACALMALYLNSFDVRVIFTEPPGSPLEGDPE